MSYTVRTIQQLIGGELTGDAEQPISGIATLERARPGELAFAEHDRYVPKVRESHASVIIVTETFPAIEGKSLLRVQQPRAAFVKVMMMFQPAASIPSGVHPSAQVSAEAVLADEVTVGECAVIRAKARIGRGTVVDSGAHVGAGVEIGEGCRIGANAVLREGTRLGHRVTIHGGAVIGEDGFGYVWAEDRHLKIPQLGNVIIEDDVEIGANVCVDRGMIGSTLIRRGTKIDNLVQIAHNDVIGEHVIMAGQVGLAGSVTVGDRTMFGGQSGAVDHVTIGADARIGAATPVTKDVKAGEMVWGFPARPIERVKHELAGLALLPQLFKRFRDALRRISQAESRLDRLERRRPTP